MDVAELHRRSVTTWIDTVHHIGSGDWDRPTPCSEWSVRDLVNHVVGEDRWTGPLMGGSTMAEVGDTLDGDLLGGDPLSAAQAAAAEARSAVGDQVAGDHVVQLSYGEERAEEYVTQLVADHLVHAWDLSAAIDADRGFDPTLVESVAEWFSEREEVYRSAGLIAAPAATTRRGRQAELLAAAGRDPDWTPARGVVEAIAAGFGRGDVDAIMAVMTDDCVFESTSPPPDGTRVVGAGDVRKVWDELFGATPGARFETEEIVTLGPDRAALRWRFSWEGGEPGHVRGVDLLRVRDGRVAEKLSYVKG